MKKSMTRIFSTIALLLGASLVSAGVIDPYLQAGSNLIEDDSGEAVLRWDPDAGDNGEYVPATGDIAVGDILIGFLDYSIINNTNIDSNGDELTSIFIVEVDSVTDAGTACTSSGAYGVCPVGGLDYDAVDLVFSSVDPAIWALVGVDLTALEGSLGLAAGDLDSTVQVFYDDDKNNLDVFTDTFAEATTHVLDGNLRWILGDAGAGATDAPASISTFLDPLLDSGVSTLGNFGYLSTFLWDNIGGDQSGYSASGSNLANATDHFGVTDDTQATFTTVPTPGTVLLLGAGLLGLGWGKSRRKTG